MNYQPLFLGLTPRAPACYNAVCQTSRVRDGRGPPSPTDGAMLHRSSQLLCAWFLLWDLTLTALSWVGAYFLRFETGWVPVTKDTPDFEQCVSKLPVVLLLAGIAYRLTGQYRIHRLRRFREEVVSVCQGTALMSLLVIAGTFSMHDPYESRATMAIFAGLAT